MILSWQTWHQNFWNDIKALLFILNDINKKPAHLFPNNWSQNSQKTFESTFSQVPSQIGNKKHRDGGLFGMVTWKRDPNSKVVNVTSNVWGSRIESPGRYTLLETNISHLGEKEKVGKIIFKRAFVGDMFPGGYPLQPKWPVWKSQHSKVADHCWPPSLARISWKNHRQAWASCRRSNMLGLEKLDRNLFLFRVEANAIYFWQWYSWY